MFCPGTVTYFFVSFLVFQSSERVGYLRFIERCPAKCIQVAMRVHRRLTSACTSYHQPKESAICAASQLPGADDADAPARLSKS